MMKRMALVVLALCLLIAAFAATGCATAGMKVRHVSTVTLATADQILSFVQDTVKANTCGQPSAPPAGQCVTTEKLAEISKKLSVGFDYDKQAAQIVRNWDPTTPMPSNLGQLLGQITTVVNQVMALLPDAPWKNKLSQLLAA